MNTQSNRISSKLFGQQRTHQDYGFDKYDNSKFQFSWNSISTPYEQQSRHFRGRPARHNTILIIIFVFRAILNSILRLLEGNSNEGTNQHFRTPCHLLNHQITNFPNPVSDPYIDYKKEQPISELSLVKLSAHCCFEKYFFTPQTPPLHMKFWSTLRRRYQFPKLKRANVSRINSL